MTAFRRVLGVAVAVAATSALSVLPVRAQTPPTTSTTAAAPAPAVHKVRVDDNFYKPKKLKVVVGDKVKWRWTGSAQHDVRVKKGPQKFRSKLQNSGTYTRTIKKPGKFTIYCTIHPGMEMKLTAEPAPPPATTTSTPPPAT